jgi:hypothetical protein
VIQLPESNVNWRHPNEFKKCRQAVKTVLQHAKLSTSSSSKRPATAKQPGGTVRIGVDNFTGRIYETGRDSQYGRWSYFKVSGQNARSIVILTVYQVCQQPEEFTMDTTTCKQQNILLAEHHRLINSMSGRVTPHPCQALIHNLSSQLCEWRAEGLEIILSGDLNEVLGDDPTQFATITTQFNLTDVYRFRHGLDEPATYQRGDSITYSARLLSSLP